MKAVLELSNKACRASGSCVLKHLLVICVWLIICYHCLEFAVIVLLMEDQGMAPSSVVGPLKTCDGWNVNSISP